MASNNGRTPRSKLSEDEGESPDELRMDWEPEKRKPATGTRFKRRITPFGNGTRTVFAKEEQSPPDPQSPEQTAGQALQDMYRDFDNIYRQVGHRWMAHNYTNPFVGYDLWPAAKQAQYLAADTEIERREYLVVAMHSNTFRNAMESFTEEQWNPFFERVGNNKESLR